MNNLDELRQRINGIDDAVVKLVAERMRLCRDMALLKKAASLPAIQPSREVEVKKRCMEMGAAAGLDAEFVNRLYETIIVEARGIQERIIGNA